VQAEVVIDELLALRTELKNSGAQDVPSINDLLIKAAAQALRRHPMANGSFSDAGFNLHAEVNVGFAVSADGTLAVPTVRDADIRSLGSIARETKRLSELVRLGKIGPDDLAGGTFTVSNLGMFGMSAIYPVINVPQAAILGVGAARAVLARVDGEIIERQSLTLTLSCDHRILYGTDAARFLLTIKTALEKPLTLAL
jgi:pyruvate dehydrogenase E2 component (dihydrolipoamide acetyltransferase)